MEREQKKRARIIREDDQRYFPRWKVNTRVEYIEEGGASFQSYTKDLSWDGTSLFVFDNPPLRRRVQLRIHLTDRENFAAQGHIAWSKLGTTHKLFGIVFENFSKKAQELIMRHAFEPRKDHLLMDRLMKRLNPRNYFASHRFLRPH